MNDKHREILLITQEECAEVSQVVSKIFRFGIDQAYTDRTNRQRLEEEVGDLVCMIELLQEHGIIDSKQVQLASEAKRNKLKTWSIIFEEQL